MTIYIYGSKSFKNNIQEVLEHANMKFRLNDEDSIVELDTLHELKEAIEEDPQNIFLIDDEKIIKKNSLNEKIKFLKPKDGIEEEFLKEHGIGDLSVDDIHDIATHIIKKLEKAHALKENLEEEYVQKQDKDIALKTVSWLLCIRILMKKNQRKNQQRLKKCCPTITLCRMSMMTTMILI